MARVREYHGGLLSVLEQHSDTFVVRRVPKADRVALVSVSASAPAAVATQSQVPQPDDVKVNEKRV